MQKTTLIALTLLLAGCSITPWHKGMCEQTDLKLIKKANIQCIDEWHERQDYSFGYHPDPRIALDYMELIRYNCEAKSKYKQCD